MAGSPRLELFKTTDSEDASTTLAEIVAAGLDSELAPLDPLFHNEPKLKDRVDGIFRRDATTFLVNTSGSGKTRLSFEGLCENWGFYFIMEGDSNHLGASDLGREFYKELDAVGAQGFAFHLPSQDSPTFAADALKRNIDIIDRIYSVVLLGRLLIFQMFSEIIDSRGITEAHKRRWLLLQLIPRLPEFPSYDIFATLQIYTCDLDTDEVQDMIAVMFSRLRKIYGPQFHLFYVIDEAQLASRAHTDAFRHDGKPYPLLREIIQSWSVKGWPHEVSFVICGTDIPKDGFESAPFTMRWCSDTGGFDNEGDHAQYVSRFLTPTYASSPAGKMFVKRVWTWCRGRYRSTDALLSALLQDAFGTPHRLLNDYVEKTTTHRPGDYHEDEPSRYRIDINLSELSPEFFDHSTVLRSNVQDVLLHYLATGRHPSPFSESMTPLVSAAFGRFIDTELSQVVMDEPLFLVRAARWLCEPLESGLGPPQSCFAVLQNHQADLTSRSLACFMAFFLARVLEHGQQLSTVFSFPVDKQGWADETAELMALDGKDSSAVDPYAFTIASPSTLSGVESWLDDAKGDVFCLRDAADPELIFNLKLEKDRFLRVILHSIVAEKDVQGDELKNVMSRLASENLFYDEEGEADDVRSRVAAKLFDTAPPDGPFEVLRTIASFPAKSSVKTFHAPHLLPAANLNTRFFRRATQAIPVSDLREMLITAVTTGKRKRVDAESTPPPDARRKPPTQLSSTFKLGYIEGCTQTQGSAPRRVQDKVGEASKDTEANGTAATTAVSALAAVVLTPPGPQQTCRDAPSRTEAHRPASKSSAHAAWSTTNLASLCLWLKRVFSQPLYRLRPDIPTELTMRSPPPQTPRFFGSPFFAYGVDSSCSQLAMDIDAATGGDGDSLKRNECGAASVVEQGGACKVEASEADTDGMDADMNGRENNAVPPEDSVAAESSSADLAGATVGVDNKAPADANSCRAKAISQTLRLK
ncbi:hypothetical protein B0H15DRAFT_956663 [Mycena belliarum]|uniref:Uncharacterized protein n=1 Tax=Mycena belliarum TaxID=1033014 RepID=A0AAD6XHF4_9AGAR|nr:hypothetical protein B0H15DRAFT_956663 [Mycena belliae]